MRWCCIIIFLLLPGARALADAGDNDRVLRTIDFEERQLNNPEDLPMHWLKVEGPAIPHYVNGKLSNDRARSGEYSFRFDLNGGSLVYRYEPGRIHVQGGSHYRIETYVQTTPLPHARARLTAYFVDVDRRTILSSIKHSPLFVSGADDAQWHRLVLEMTAKQEADSLVVELELLQPAVYQPNILGASTIYPQDIHGSAWFDDVIISQVPRVGIFTDHPGNIYRPGEPLSLRVLVSDRSTDDLAGQLVVVDAAGKVVYQRSSALDIATAEDLGGGQKQMKLLLPPLASGWYEASLLMTSRGKSIGRSSLALVRLADEGGNPRPDMRFGLSATDLPFDGWGELPALLPYLGAGRVKLAVWNATGSIEQADPDGFDKLLVRLSEIGVTPTACLLDLPPSVVKNVGPGGWPAILSAKPEDWQPQLAYLISRHANHLERWQLGADGTDVFVNQPGMREVYGRIYAEFTKLVQKPDLAMPWPAWYELDGQIPPTVALSVHSAVLPHQLPLYLQDIRKHQGHNLSLTFELLDLARYGREVQIRDLAQRTIYALAAGATRIDLPLPFTASREDEELVKQPQEMLMIVRTLAMTLGGAEFKGKVPLADDIEAFLFEKNGQGILAVWERGPSGRTRQFALALGERPRAVDLWGNATPLIRPRSVESGNDKVQINVGPMPIFLMDIDPSLAQLRASVAIDRPLLESSFQPHPRRIHFVNPWKTAISGTLKLKAPPGWAITPPTMQFNINPGEAFDKEISIEFPYNSFAGPKTLTAEFSILDAKVPSIVVPITLNLGLTDVGMQTLAIRDGANVLVQQVVTNYGDKPINYTAFAIFPGQPRQERLITNLAPGRTTIKLYRFPSPKAEKVDVRTGVKELDGNRILNEMVEVR
jgi:hypothetical protein